MSGSFGGYFITSIGLPDDTLASRNVMIPLVRSGDKEKTRRKPTNPRDWEGIVDSKLRDQLWLNVAQGLADIEALKEEVYKSTDLSGRDFDIFQGLLTVALWLERKHGVQDLFSRMLKVMEAYHETKQKNLLPSMEQVVLQSLMNRLNEKDDNSDILTTQTIVSYSLDVLRNWDITDESLTSMDVQKVGMLLSRLGFNKSASHGKARSWQILRDTVEEKAKVAGVTLEGNRMLSSREASAPIAIRGGEWQQPKPAMEANHDNEELEVSEEWLGSRSRPILSSVTDDEIPF